MPVTYIKPAAPKKIAPDPRDDNRKGRLHEIKTDRGEFRFKDNRKGG